jgi:hypothetical protein
MVIREGGQVEGSTQTRQEHNLNQQQDLDQLNMADSEIKICKGYGTDGCRTGNKYGSGLWDEGKNTRTKGKYELDRILEALIPLDGDVIPDLPSGSR